MKTKHALMLAGGIVALVVLVAGGGAVLLLLLLVTAPRGQQQQPTTEARAPVTTTKVKPRETSIVGVWVSTTEGGAGMVFKANGAWGATGSGLNLLGTWKEDKPGHIIVTTNDDMTLDLTYRFEGNVLIVTYESGSTTRMTRKQ